MSRLGTVLAVLATVGAAAVPAHAASAARVRAAKAGAAASATGTWNCDAAALSGSVLGAAPVDLVTANHGQATCRTASGSLADLTGGLPLPLAAGTLSAQTFLLGPAGAPDQQRVTGVGGLRDFGIPAASLPIQLPSVTIPAVPFASVPVQLPALPLPASLPGLPPILTAPPQVTVDLRQLLAGIVPALSLPKLDLLHADALFAQASGFCSGGRPQLLGTSQVAGLSVLGQSVPIGPAVTRTVNLAGGGAVDPSSLKVADVLALVKAQLPAPFNALDLSAISGVTSTIQSVLDGLPSIPIPTVPASVTIAPGARTEDGDRLIQRALQVQVTALGKSIADLVLGEASASSAGVDCNPVTGAVAPPPVPETFGPAATSLALQCTTRKLVLVDVVPRGDHVDLFGAADRRFAGRRVDIVFTATGKTVARPLVDSGGLFRATAPLPPRAVRNTNDARYQAVLGGERSLRLKLVRRMLVDRVTPAGNQVTIAGHVVRPLGRPVQDITLKRRVSCNQEVLVARTKPDRNGRFRLTVPAPDTQQAGAYRLQTQVRNNTRNPKLFPTFTLPRFVESS